MGRDDHGACSACLLEHTLGVCAGRFAVCRASKTVGFSSSEDL